MGGNFINMDTKFTFLNDFEGQKNFKEDYKDNALLLYALQLRFDIEDIDAVAADALTDGANDKKCDLIFVERDLGVAVVAQAYNKVNPNMDDTAKGNKASDLNTAAAWVFKDEVEKVPSTIRDAVIELREAIKAQEISTIYFWYVHNLDETKNSMVEEEMYTMQEQVQAAVDTKYSSDSIRVSAMEVGLNTIQKWYDTSTRRITIEDEIDVKCKEGFEIQTDKWRSFVTAVSGKWLRQLFLEKGEELFSGNPRSYLGRGRKNNINSGIIASVQEEPENFWVYNNGVTALVNDFEYNDKLLIKGITIINGAQTTGAISTPEETQIKDDFYIPCRFIVCSDKTIIDSIINNNNKQNKILPSDLRSNDKQQERLRKEFKKYSDLFYNGGRRDDKKVRNKVVFDPYFVAQTLLAYHGDSVTAYNGKQRIWEDDKLYTSIFMDQLNAEHIIFVYSLSKAIDTFKNRLRDKGSNRTETENKQIEFLSKRGSKMLLIATISGCLEDLIGRKINDKWKLRFKNNSDFEQLKDYWEKIISIIISFNGHLEPALEGGLKNKELVKAKVQSVKDIVSSLKDSYSKMLEAIIGEIAY